MSRARYVRLGFERADNVGNSLRVFFYVKDVAYLYLKSHGSS